MSEPAEHPAQPLDSSARSPSGSRIGRPARQVGLRPGILLFATAVVVWAADQGSKYLALHHLARNERVDLIGSLFGLRLTSNPGAAFSMATNSTWVFTVIATVVVLMIVRIAGRLGSSGWALALGLLLGGALGNLTDRLIRPPSFGQGHVIDFLELPHWPIFNLADSCITTAAVVIALLSVLGIGFDGRRTSPEQGEPADG